MGLLPASSDIPDYAPIVGPELELAGPAYLIQLKGNWTDRRGDLLIDPTCAVIGGSPFMYASHGSVTNGVFEAPPPATRPVTKSLPPMEP